MTFRYENQKIKQGYKHIIGCDEVGRGSLAGPVVAGAVVFPVESLQVFKLKEIRDSKQLTPEKREELSGIIKENALAWSIGEVSCEDIDVLNIHHASLLAMRRAVEKMLRTYSYELATRKVLVVIDGKFVIPNFPTQQEAVIGGDAKVLSVAAASIIAKVYRDDLMRKLHNSHPHYNFAQHKGYATEYHRNAILQHGLSPIHRLSFCEHLV